MTVFRRRARNRPPSRIGPRFAILKRRGGKEEGQSLVELALSITALLLILLGTIDFGRLFFDFVQLRNAAREGASYGARSPQAASWPEISARVTGHGVPAGTTVTIKCTPAPDNCSGVTLGSTHKITVVASHTFRPIATNFFSRYGLDTIPLNVGATMRIMS